MNFFSNASAAERYKHGRPPFHPLVVRRIKEFLSLDEKLPRALDVACGTGLSTVALRGVADEVFGADASFEMLARAKKETRVRYVNCPAEKLPFASGAFDLLTVCQGFHWFEREKFFAEARRVLRARGRLVVYDNYFSGEMESDERFRAWFREAYLTRYPSPPRCWVSFTEEETRGAGFRLLGHEALRDTARFSVESLTDYLVTQTNVIAAVEGGGEEIAEVRRWLAESVRPLFGGNSEVAFLFDAPIWYLQTDVSEAAR